MTGTTAGSHTPEMMEWLNVPGFHFRGQAYGGFIPDLILENAPGEPDITPGFRMDLPASGDFLGIDLTGKLSGELAVVEQGTG